MQDASYLLASCYMEIGMTDRIQQILHSEKYREYLARIEVCEADRVFCHHDMGHFLDVARIATILNRKEDYGLKDEMIYAASLLHDVGRWKQYETGDDHAIVSSRLAPAILEECGFGVAEREEIISAIATHREQRVMGQKNLNGLLYRADKLSRPCFFCKQEGACNWKKDKKNERLVW